MLFLKRPYPYYDEIFYSYAIRLAKANATNVIDTYQLCGLTYRKMHPEVLFIEEFNKGGIFERLGKEALSKSHFFLQTTESNRIYTIDFLGELLPHYLINSRRVKVCPVCIIEKGYLSCMWQLVHVNVCPFHHCLLLDKCQLCGKFIKWHSGILERCSCLARWEQQVPKLKTIKNEKILELTQYIYSIMCKIPYDKGQFLCEDIFELSYVELTTLLSLIAWVMPDAEPFWNMNHVEKKENEATYNTLVEVLNILVDWPSNFHAFLRSLEERQKYRKFSSEILLSGRDSKYLNLFTEFYLKLYSQNHLQFAKSEFERFLLQYKFVSIHLYKKIDFSSYGDSLGEQINNKNEIGKRFKIKDGVKLAKNLTLSELQGQTVLSLKEAALVLGVTDEIVVELTKEDIVHALSTPGAQGIVKWSFNAKSIFAILTKFEHMVYQINDDKVNLVDFREASVSQLSGGYIPSMKRIVQKVLSGQLHPRKMDANLLGLNQFFFNKKDIRQAFTNEINEMNQGLTIKEAAKRLHLSKNRLTYFIRKGYIGCTKNKRGATIVTSEHIDGFKQRYCTTSEIKQRTGIHVNKVVPWLRERGITPVNEVIDDKSHQYLFQKNDELRQVYRF